MDLGGHRFFSKSDWVMRWWQEILLIVADGTNAAIGALRIHYQGQSRHLTPGSLRLPPPTPPCWFRRRLSRIFYRRRFFDYPLTLNASTVKNLGLVEAFKIGLSYCRA